MPSVVRVSALGQQCTGMYTTASESTLAQASPTYQRGGLFVRPDGPLPSHAFLAAAPMAQHTVHDCGRRRDTPMPEPRTPDTPVCECSSGCRGVSHLRRGGRGRGEWERERERGPPSCFPAYVSAAFTFSSDIEAPLSDAVRSRRTSALLWSVRRFGRDCTTSLALEGPTVASHVPSCLLVSAPADAPA